MYPIVWGQLRISNKAGEIPALSVLRTGEIAYNTVDGIIYLKRVVDGIDTIISFTSAQDILEEIASALGGVSLESKQLPDGHGVRLLTVSGVIIDPAKEETLHTLAGLTQSLQDLVARLSGLNSALTSGIPALRVVPLSSVSTAVTGTVTANIGTNGGMTTYAQAIAAMNILPTLANINNVVT